MKKEKIEQIEKILSKAIQLLNENDYISLIEENDNLKSYDSIMTKYDEVNCSDIYLKQLDEAMLDDIINYLEKRLTIN